MALNDAATLAVDSGNYFTAPTGTAIPANVKTVATPWENIGHTSLEDILAFESEGGEATVIGTLQNRSLRTRRSNRSETLRINLQQFDTPALKLYYGSNATVVNGAVTAPAQPVPTTCAFLAVFLDGANAFGLYVPKCEILRGDDVELSDTEGLVSLPLGITPLQNGVNNWLYSITPLGGAAE